MQVPVSYAVEFASRVKVLDTAAKELLAKRLAAVDFAADGALEEYRTIMREVCGAATGKTSDLAAAFYDRVRALYDGLPSFEALAESHLNEAELRRLIEQRCSGIPPGDTERLVEELQRILGDEVVREKFTTMQANGRRDPAKPYFARVPVPSSSVYGHKPGQTHNPYLAQHGTCAFCEILASRGFVYLERATANAHVHDGCNCVPMPGFEHGRTKVGGYNPDEYLKRYTEMKAKKEKAKENKYAQATMRE